MIPAVDHIWEFARTFFAAALGRFLGDRIAQATARKKKRTKKHCRKS